MAATVDFAPVRFRASTLATVVDGILDGPDVVVDGATQDTRAIQPGQLFVPLVAERDGHSYVVAALEAGAGAYLSSRGSMGGTAILVDDTLAALVAMAGAARDRVDGPVVGVTGSVGKTTTKDLLAAVLARTRRTGASDRSFNNEIGVPLTLCNLPEGAEAAVVEMGARGVGHIAALCAIARPTVGVVTVVAPAHLELFGTIDDVARGKGELVECLPASGLAVLNADDRRVAAMGARTRADVLTYGVGAGDVRAESVALDEELRPSFVLHSEWGRAHVRLGARGAHNVANALAAAAVGLAYDVPLAEVVEALAQPITSPWRMDVRRAASGALIINDAYNANPESMAAALRSLSAVAADRRVAVLGVMAELGADADAAHADIAAMAAAQDIDVIAVDAPAYGSSPGVRHVVSVAAALAAVGPLGAGDAVLVKGSRVAGLERVAAELTQ
jgi:UDP-N-acetylmuramoyl-tripeptide--D-alanyl-D-alanine ligase